MLIAGAELYYRRPVPRAAACDAAALQPAGQSPPYLAVATTYALLVHAVMRRGPIR